MPHSPFKTVFSIFATLWVHFKAKNKNLTYPHKVVILLLLLKQNTYEEMRLKGSKFRGYSFLQITAYTVGISQPSTKLVSDTAGQ